jgi:HSP20 family protein
MAKDNRSFFEKLTGAVRLEDEPEEEVVVRNNNKPAAPDWGEESPEEGELAIDVYQSLNDIIIKTMVAGVKPEDLDVSISRDMVTVKGRRENEKMINESDYFHRELYWGTFSRTVVLPEEIDVDAAEAVEKHGLLILRLPKLDKNRQTKIKVKGN